MSAPFQPGDVVVCVDDRTSPGSPIVRFKRGKEYRVRSVFLTEGRQRRHDIFGEVVWGIVIAGFENKAAAAQRFRKIDEGVTEEFREQLRSLKSPKPTLNPSRHSRERVA